MAVTVRTTNKAPAPDSAAAVRQRIRDAIVAAGVAESYNNRTGELTDNARVVLRRRYLSKDRDGNVLEDPDGMFRRVARNLSQSDLEYGATEAERAATEQRFYEVMRRLEFLPNSPTLMNAGRELQQLSACFVLPVADSLDAIFTQVKQTALIHKSGGGTGFAFSRLRPEGDVVGSTGGVASGPVSFINAFDAATDVVKQGGTRRGANMGILHVTHPDIMEFITAKENGQRLSNFNISVAVTEDFMRRVERGEDYDLVNPRTGQVMRQLNAKAVFERMTELAWRTGDPGIVFLDRINRDNPNPQLGDIESTNPCVTADTWVQTTEGPRLVGELVGVPFTAVVNGEIYLSGEQGFFRTGRKAVLRLITREGYSLSLTADHLVMTDKGWQGAASLEKDDVITVNGHCNFSQWPGQYGEADGLLLGRFFMKNPHRIVSDLGANRTRKDPQEPTAEESALLDEIRRRLNIDPQNPTVTPEMERSSSEFYAGFFRGLSRRHHEHTGKNPKCINVAPRNADGLTLQGLQRMLLRLAIKSSIWYGEGYPELLVANEHFDKYNAVVKPDGFERWLEIAQSPGNNRSFTARVAEVKSDGAEDVFDVAVPGVNAFDANGFYVHNCGEQPLLPYESCNLGSLNLARMVRYTDNDVAIDWPRMAEVITAAVHMLDSVIDMNEYPIAEIAEMSRRTRRIGLGVMGWSDLLIQLGIRYDSDAALELAREVMRFIQTETYRASAELATARGPFPEWERSAYNMGENPRPVRNSAPVTIAPTGTISIIAGASSGIEPLFALSYVRNVMDNTRLVEGNAYFEAVARHEGFYSIELMEQLAAVGSLEELDVPAWVKDVFRVSHDIAPRWHVRMQAAFQEYTDNAVSKTINFPHDAAVADVAEAYQSAYALGCKGITVYRDGSKADQVLSTGAATGAAQSGDKPAVVEIEVPAPRVPRDRPRQTRGITERVRTGHGNMYVTVNLDREGLPFEVFGTMGKAGGCDAALLEAVSRLVSLALRAGIDTNEVARQLRGITCCPVWDDGTLVRSGPDALALVLDNMMRGINGDGNAPAGVQLTLPTGSPGFGGDGPGVGSAIAPQPAMRSRPDADAGNGNGHAVAPAYPGGFAQRCPECNGGVVNQEGCSTCYSCGWNKCE